MSSAWSESMFPPQHVDAPSWVIPQVACQPAARVRKRTPAGGWMYPKPPSPQHTAAPSPSSAQAMSPTVGSWTGLRGVETLTQTTAEPSARLAALEISGDEPSGELACVSVGPDVAFAVRTDSSVACWGLGTDFGITNLPRSVVLPARRLEILDRAGRTIVPQRTRVTSPPSDRNPGARRHERSRITGMTLLEVERRMVQWEPSAPGGGPGAPGTCATPRWSRAGRPERSSEGSPRRARRARRWRPKERRSPATTPASRSSCSSLEAGSRAATGRRDKSRMLARRMKRTAGHDGMVVIDYLLKRS
jgi:hypothetical protein